MLREFRNGELAVLVDDGGFRPRAAERRAGSEQEAEIVVAAAVRAHAHRRAEKGRELQ